MEHSKLEIVYLHRSCDYLSCLREDQLQAINGLIAYMRGSTFGTAVLEPPISSKVTFYPSIEAPETAAVVIGKIRVHIQRNCERVTVSARKR
ncbi:hypothetical protein FJZ27_00820 [Candidatus Peribacteria bacterium]|nr:hypothetical protein [Candidatus Peribacteria bacterium]